VETKNLKPEIKSEFELGTDLHFFKVLTINATYYSNETKDLLVQVPLNGVRRSVQYTVTMLRSK
jgi:hypothetical protein